MIYLDYAAHTPVSDEVLDFFCKHEKEYIANPNSLHELGLASKSVFSSITSEIKDLLMIENRDVIVTSGASESNSIAIKGNLDITQNKKKKIITSYLEHSSVLSAVTFLKDRGYEVEFVDILPSGLIDLDHLKELMTNETRMVSIGMIDSEIGIIQPIKEIASIVKNYSECLFHCDMTQSIGKISSPINYVDFATFSPHKFNGLNGTGILIKRSDVKLKDFLHISSNGYQDRMGTPTLSLYASTKKALEISLSKKDQSFEYVSMMKDYIIRSITQYKNVVINTPRNNSTPYIVNLSVMGVKAHVLRDYLSQNGVCISTKSACSSDNNQSRAVYALTKDKKRATSSVRISMSDLTTIEEIDIFLSCFDKAYTFLTNK